MKNLLLVFVLVIATYTTASATTAILCGPSAKVDQNNNLASVWIILDNETIENANEVKVIFKGKETKVTHIQSQIKTLNIFTSEPQKMLVLNKENIESSACDGESFFNIYLKQENNIKTINECRCFVD